ncbi:TPA: carboxypeptidase regulatory-like domain-containing protein [Candidatus Woesearchaeota archaeon]|nr:carboxypeptidase regulatory-like domain-containing protein [Candidatus Woesearchaeota archaeon]
MNKKSSIVLILMIVASFLISCTTNENTLTGGVTTNTVSTAIVMVKGDDGRVIDDASIFINDEFKGTTNKYGQGKGTREVILQKEENTISIEKEGYYPSEPRKIQISSKGQQQITITIQKQRVEYQLNIEDEEGTPVSDAKVYLFKFDDTLPLKTTYSNDEGEAVFTNVNDGEYTLKIVKAQFQKWQRNETISFSSGEESIHSITLSPLPEINAVIQDQNNLPISGAEVSLYTTENYNKPGSWPLATKQSTKEGTVKFDSLNGEEEYVLVIKKEGFTAQTTELAVGTTSTTAIITLS